MEFNFQGKTALVTGASSGIGRDLTKRLIDFGAHVIAVGQDESKLNSLKAEIGNDRVIIVQVNLGNWKETETKLKKLCSNVDFLVNNAGYAVNSPVDEVTEEDLDKLLNINLKAPINLTKMVVGGMKERKFGSIVNVSSVSSLAALDDHLAYASTKAALDMVTKVSAKELGPFNIRVNSINPTVVWTDMAKKHWSDPVRKASMTSKIPMGRFVEVKEVIDPIIYLLSNYSSIINGITLPIDGGFSAT